MGLLWWGLLLLSWGSFLRFFPCHSSSMPAHRELKRQILQIVWTNLKRYSLTYFPRSTDSNYQPYGSKNREWTVYSGFIHSCCFFRYIPFSDVSANIVHTFASLLLHLGIPKKRTNLSFFATATRGCQFPSEVFVNTARERAFKFLLNGYVLFWFGFIWFLLIWF